MSLVVRFARRMATARLAAICVVPRSQCHPRQPAFPGDASGCTRHHHRLHAHDHCPGGYRHHQTGAARGPGSSTAHRARAAEKSARGESWSDRASTDAQRVGTRNTERGPSRALSAWLAQHLASLWRPQQRADALATWSLGYARVHYCNTGG